MMIFDFQKHAPVGPGGELAVHAGDEVTLKLAMLYSGECTDLGPLQAAASFGFSKQRYFQLRHLFNERGSCGPAKSFPWAQNPLPPYR